MRLWNTCWISLQKCNLACSCRVLGTCLQEKWAEIRWLCNPDVLLKFKISTENLKFLKSIPELEVKTCDSRETTKVKVPLIPRHEIIPFIYVTNLNRLWPLACLSFLFRLYHLIYGLSTTQHSTNRLCEHTLLVA